MKTHTIRNHGNPMRTFVVLMLGVLTALPSLARQADREESRYVGSRALASTVIEWRADHVVESRTGEASVYSSVDYRRRTSSGERYDRSAMTAAHANYPLDSMVRVTHLDTDRRIVVRINDRLIAGSNAESNALIKLSESAAARLGLDSGDGPRSRRVRIELLSSETVPAVEFRPRRPGDEARTVTTRPGEARTATSSQEGRTIQVTTVNHSVRPASDESYTLQIGAFSTLDAARRLAADVEGAWVMQIVEEGERVYRVYYGQFDREQTARVAQDRLKEKGRDSFLRTIPS